MKKQSQHKERPPESNNDPGPETDAALVRLARTDERAFGELYWRYHRRVYAYHLLRTANAADAEDLTSQTFMAALEGLGSFRGEGAFGAWLMGIAHNKLALYYRGRTSETSLDEVENRPHQAVPPEESAGQRDLLQKVGQALKLIGAERAEALVLRIFAGLSTAETAVVMDRSEGAVKMLVYRALQDIRSILHEDLPLEEQ